MSATKVPFVDLQAQLKKIRPEIDRAIGGVLDKCNFILGDEVQKLEASFAKYSGATHGVGLANGTEAIHMAVRAVGVKEGDEVIVPAHTFIATALGATYAGAKVRLVDIDERTFLMDPSRLEKAITPKTKAIIPVHLYGRMMDLDSVMSIARKHGIPVIEDTAQAHGAELRGKRAGSVGAIGCFSFYPGKNLGCYGDGGMVVTSDPELKATLEALRNYGSTKKYHHPFLGFNSRLDTLQAAVLNVKLPHLDSYNQARYRIAARYNEELAGVGDLILPEIPAAGSHVFHLYVIRTKRRDALLQFLGEKSVFCGIHYPTPIHLHGTYTSLGYKRGDFPVAERICDEILSLPMFPELSDEQNGYAVSQVRAFFGK